MNMCYIRYNETQVTRVHEDRSTSVVLRESMQLNFDDEDDTQHVSIIVKDQVCALASPLQFRREPSQRHGQSRLRVTEALIVFLQSRSCYSFRRNEFRGSPLQTFIVPKKHGFAIRACKRRTVERRRT